MHEEMEQCDNATQCIPDLKIEAIEVNRVRHG